MASAERVKKYDLLETAFRADGFLADDLSAFEDYVADALAPWFDLAVRINKFGQQTYAQATSLLPGQDAKGRICLGTQLIARGLSTFQSSIRLVKIGAGLEAEILIRSLYENGFWLAYFLADEQRALVSFRNETLRSEKSLHKVSLERLRNLEDKSKAQLAETIADLDNEIKSLPKKETIEAVSSAGKYADYYVFYKAISNTSAHPSLKSLHDILWYDENGELVGQKIGPDEHSSGRAIWLGCRAMLMNLDCIVEITELREHADQIGLFFDELENLTPHLRSGTA